MLLMLDETIVTETPPLYSCYGPIGEQVRVPISGTHNKRVLHGAINQGHRIKIGGLGRMANSAFGGKLNLCGTCSHLFTMVVVYLVVDNKYNVYVR